ncbi:hypothetical protein [Bacillus cereus]|uniref:hypothetical protein n=1 Tax=Bacillus cereus TaxID=1396 RepID=UPI0024BE286E|nr:hypothetical protein [Bacillus cereus]
MKEKMIKKHLREFFLFKELSEEELQLVMKGSSFPTDYSSFLSSLISLKNKSSHKVKLLI